MWKKMTKPSPSDWLIPIYLVLTVFLSWYYWSRFSYLHRNARPISLHVGFNLVGWPLLGLLWTVKGIVWLSRKFGRSDVGPDTDQEVV